MNNWSTASLPPPSPRLIDQVIGQEKAVRVIRLAARQRRFVLLVGEPGTGKSMLGRSMADLLEVPKLKPLVTLPNGESPMCPHVRFLNEAELGSSARQWTPDCRSDRSGNPQPRDMESSGDRAAYHRILLLYRQEAFAQRYLVFFAGFCLWISSLWMFFQGGVNHDRWGYPLAALLGSLFLWQKIKHRSPAHATQTPAPHPGAGQTPVKGPHSSREKAGTSLMEPRVLCRPNPDKAPFVDATGFSEGALFGDVRHDPYQSGGVESPPHQLVELGAVHRAHGGVLYIDEIGTLSLASQRLLLTAIQDRELPITGRHAGSSGTLVTTNPVPCDFILVAAGNREDLEHLLPALRSRIRGFGYEVMTLASLEDGPDKTPMLARFIAQEVAKDGKIPHFRADAVEEIHRFARILEPAEGHITARWRELGGLIRIAGDLAVDAGDRVVDADHVRAAWELQSLNTDRPDREGNIPTAQPKAPHHARQTPGGDLTP